MTTTTYTALTAGDLAQSQHQAVHLTAIEAVRETLADLPGYLDARRGLRQVADYRPVRPAGGADEISTMLATIVSAVDSGKPIPEDLTAGVLDSRRQEDLAAAAAQAVERARLGYVLAIDSAVERHAGKIMAALTTALVEVTDQASELLARGARLLSADAAIDAGRVEDYQAAQELESSYVQLRSLQRAEHQAVHGGLLSTSAAHVMRFLGNPLDVLDLGELQELLERRREPQGQPGVMSTVWSTPADWLDPAALWWFAERTEAEPWAPTAAEYEELSREVHQAVEAGRRAADGTPARAKVGAR